MYKVYQVLPNDTLETVAKKANITISDLAALNGIRDNTSLIPGTFIVVPAINSNFDSYTIQKGDTIYSIASRLNVDPNDLLLLNGLNKNDYIYPNDILLIPKQGYGIYITKDSDSLNDVINKTNTNVNEFTDQNPTIYLKKDQLFVYKKEIN